MKFTKSTLSKIWEKTGNPWKTQYRRFPRYKVNGVRERPQTAAYLEFPRKSNLVISS